MLIFHVNMQLSSLPESSISLARSDSTSASSLTGRGETKGRYIGGRERGLFEGGDYFEYFNQKGAILRGRRLIEGSYIYLCIIQGFMVSLLTYPAVPSCMMCEEWLALQQN